MLVYNSIKDARSKEYQDIKYKIDEVNDFIKYANIHLMQVHEERENLRNYITDFKGEHYSQNEYIQTSFDKLNGLTKLKSQLSIEIGIANDDLNLLNQDLDDVSNEIRGINDSIYISKEI